MPQAQKPLPAEVRAALDRDEAIEAIRLLREATGIGLAEAKALVDAHRRGARPTTDALPPAAIAALERGDRIGAIRHVRDATGMGLKEAKDRVDAVAGPAPVGRGAARVVAIALILVVAVVFLWLRGGK